MQKFSMQVKTLVNGNIIATGGRLLCVTALGNTIGEAQAKALEPCQKVTFDSVQSRKDIGYRAIARKNASSL